jgi:hypothetical protein
MRAAALDTIRLALNGGNLRLGSSLLALDRNSTLGRLKPLPHRADHLEEPIPIERVQGEVAGEVNQGQPDRHGGGVAGEEHEVDVRVGRVGGRRERGVNVFLGGRAVDRVPHVDVDDGRLVGTPDQAAEEEGDEQGDAVVQLGLGARHVELVEEPVDVEEGSGELVEDEDGGVEVEVGALGGEELAGFSHGKSRRCKPPEH